MNGREKANELGDRKRERESGRGMSERVNDKE